MAKKAAVAPAGILLSIGFWTITGKTLQEIGWFFLKAGASCIRQRIGYCSLPAWWCGKRIWRLNEHQFLDAVAWR